MYKSDILMTEKVMPQTNWRPMEVDCILFPVRVLLKELINETQPQQISRLILLQTNVKLTNFINLLFIEY